MKDKKTYFILKLTLIMCLFYPQSPRAEDDAELVKKLANPVASLISLPFQYNYDEKYGVAEDGSRHFINIQPVIPISLSEDWNLISRTILPIIDQSDIPSGSSESGIGDILQSFFFSPTAPTSHGIVWGVGPAFTLPTATDSTLGGEKWAAGPTVVMLKQEGPWTFGALSNHLWSFAGDSERSDINATYLQPFLTYITKTYTSISLNSESTYDWRDDDWSMPVNFFVAQLFKIGNQRMQFGVGPRYWIDSLTSGPEGWGARAQFTLLFPK